MSGNIPSMTIAPAGGSFGTAVDSAASKFSIPTAIFRSLIQTESASNPYPAVGKDGEIGPGQIMPYNVPAGVNPYDPTQNVNLSASILSGLYQKFGNWRDALASYNKGSNLTAGYSYADKVLTGAGLPAGTSTGPSNAVAQGSTAGAAAPGPTTQVYVVALILILALTIFGLYGVVKG
jgi:soluble lytic murein transglycosylase-like protein